MKTTLYLKDKQETTKFTTTSFRKFIRKNEKKCIVCNLLSKAFRSARYRSQKFGKNDYFSSREKSGLISFLPFGKEHKVDNEGRWIKSGRQEIKPARFARDFLNPRLLKYIRDEQLAAFAANFNNNDFSSNYEFIVTDVKTAYSTNIGSCMQGKRVHQFYESYGCKALMCKEISTGQWVARAIIWPNMDFIPRKEGCTALDYSKQTTFGWFIDKVYSHYRNNINFYTLYNEYAQDNDMHIRWGIDSYDVIVNFPDGTRSTGCLIKRQEKKIELEGRRNVFVPYLDTLRYINKGNSIVATRPGILQDITYRASDTCGSKHMDSHVIDDMGRVVQVYQVIYHSNGRPFLRTSENVIQVKDHTGELQAAFKDDSGITRHNGDYVFKKDLVTINRKKYHVSDRVNLYKRNGEYFLRPAARKKLLQNISADLDAPTTRKRKQNNARLSTPASV